MMPSVICHKCAVVWVDTNTQRICLANSMNTIAARGSRARERTDVIVTRRDAD